MKESLSGSFFGKKESEKGIIGLPIITQSPKGQGQGPVAYWLKLLNQPINDYQLR
jgi:hypothetical protein